MKHDLTWRDADIVLNPLSYEDSQHYRRLRNVEANRRWFVYTGTISCEAQREWYQAYLRREDDYMFSVYSPNGTFLGGVALYNIEKDRAEFGRLLIDRTAYGKPGAGYYATRALCHLAREELGLTLLHLEVLTHNLPALKTYEKAEFKIIRQYTLSEKPYLSEKSGQNPADCSRDFYYMEKIL